MARPSTPLISRSSATEAALAVLDDHGVDGFSLGLVADRLGVRPPSLYHHFRDKSELLQEVARLVLVNVPTVEPAGPGFEERIIAKCIATRRKLLCHPNAATLILRYFPRHLLLAAYDREAREEPYPAEFQLVVIEAIEKYTYGAALFEASSLARHMPQMPSVDGVKYPSLARAVADNPFDDEQLFAEALRAFLFGIGERIRAQAVGAPLAPDPECIPIGPNDWKGRPEACQINERKPSMDA